MSLVSAVIQEVQAEAAITRSVLERVPDNRLTWRPHPKSMTAGELALHVAFEPGALVETARRGGVDFGAHQIAAGAAKRESHSRQRVAAAPALS